jgi:hypothetical protein
MWQAHVDYSSEHYTIYQNIPENKTYHQSLVGRHNLDIKPE